MEQPGMSLDRASAHTAKPRRISPKEAARLEAIERLRAILKPGDTVHCVLRHCSRSGMQRVIELVKVDCASTYAGAPRMLHIGYNAALAMGDRYDRDRNGIVIGGCGMDMGFALVYNLARTLWPDGHDCSGRETCASNDHSNGDRSYEPHRHSDGGYALKHSWL